jgi:hypothetical protein
MRRSTEGQLASLISLGDGSTLSLDFTTMSGLDSRFTFSRSSTATFINSSGLVQYADSNLLLRSNDFSTNWTPVRSTRTGGQTDPEGGTTAWEILADATASTHRMYQQSISTSQMAASHVTFSVTAKSGTSDYFYIGVGNQNESRVARQIFDLSNGTLGSAAFNGGGNAPTIESATATSLGNGWWRVVVVITAFKYIDSNDNNYAVWIGVTDNSSSLTTAASSGASAYFLRAQLSAGPTERPYYETTTSQYQAPRFDHDPTTLAPKGLLLEGSATNICLNGSMAYTSTAPTNWTRVVSGCTVASVDSTTFPGQKAWSIAATGAGQRDFLTQNFAVAANTTYTISVYIEAVTGTLTTFSYVAGLPVGATTEDIQNPSSTGRFSYKINIGATAGTVTLRIGIGTGTGTGVSADASVRFSHVQIETGSGASSYIPTGAGTVQRAADSCSMDGANFSSWFNASEGTFLARGSRRLTSNTGMLLSANDAGNNEAMGLGSSTTGEWLIRDGGSDVADITPGTATANTVYRIAGAYKVNDAQAAFNGTLGTQDTSLTLPTVNQLDIGRDRVTVYLDGHVELIKYWPTRLPDATLQALTQ